MNKFGLGALRVALAIAFVTTASAFLVAGVYNGLLILMALFLAALLLTLGSVRSFLLYMAGREDEYGRRTGPADVGRPSARRGYQPFFAVDPTAQRSRLDDLDRPATPSRDAAHQ